ncbi:hypothetical protein [Paenibacillus xylanilyticus]|uniref:Uncharacterized protein n=1 Tax=Paenibacillus xylanilyticus TaxID=248903 RepID=A0A7Y6ESZ6_9BACL|nr:hypothetical protein [Paenibacillus xylanilyticus]NUU74036.1 hypothetical protein [Paenibacillus xylanilyticus]
MTAKKLYAGTLNTADTTIYTVPDGKTTIIKSIVLCNMSSSTDNTIALMIGGKDGSGSSWVFNGKVLKASDTLVIPLVDYAMASGGKIRLWSSGGSVTARISGEEIDEPIESTEYESYIGTMTQTSNVLVPAVNYKRIIKSMFIGNASADSSVYLAIGGSYVVMRKQIKYGDAILIPFMDQVLEAGESITGYKSNTATVVPHITLIRVDD